MASFEELLSELESLIRPQRSAMPVPSAVTSAEDLRTPVNALLATQPLAGPPVQPTGEVRAVEPTAGERARIAVNRLIEPIVGPAVAERVGEAVNMLLDYGSLPAQVATDVVLQPVRAGEAVGRAAADPTLANVTNAAVQTAATLGRPMLALGALGLGTAEAARRDLGLTFGGDAAAEETTTAAQADPLAGLYAQRQALDQRRQGALARMEAERRTGEGPRFQQAKQEYDNLTAEIAGLDRLIAQRERMNAPEEQERQRAIRRAELARERELRRERRFSDTQTGRLYESLGGLAPMAAGGITGFGSRLATGGGTARYNYWLPGALGTLAGVGAANLPLAYNVLATEPDNPVRNALLAYARELPEDHPERERALREASALPEENPVRTVAAREFYDPIKLAERAIMGGVEGALGGFLGADVVRAAGRPLNALLSASGSRRGITEASTPISRSAETLEPQKEVIIERVDKAGRRYRYVRGTGKRVALDD